MQIQIVSSTMIRRKYNSIAKICRESETPVFLTKNGEEDLVAISMEQFLRRERQLLFRERLVEIEKRRRAGVKDLSAHAVLDRFRDLIENYKLLELTQENEYPDRKEGTKA